MLKHPDSHPIAGSPCAALDVRFVDDRLAVMQMDSRTLEDHLVNEMSGTSVLLSPVSMSQLVNVAQPNSIMCNPIGRGRGNHVSVVAWCTTPAANRREETMDEWMDDGPNDEKARLSTYKE